MHQISLKFATGSKYDGIFTESMNLMDGFGRYTYPDGAEYLGSFKKGLFHGFGRLRLGKPYNFTFRGEFENGILTKIEDMFFSDGLRYRANITEDGKVLDTNNWSYCTEADRRFSGELNWGIEPFGPNAYLTKWRKARKLRPFTYDTEEGIYSSKSGFITHREPPFVFNRFVSCIEEQKSILKHCRSYTTKSVVEPNVEFGCSIIETNLGLPKGSIQKVTEQEIEETKKLQEISRIIKSKLCQKKRIETEETELQLTSSIDSQSDIDIEFDEFGSISPLNKFCNMEVKCDKVDKRNKLLRNSIVDAKCKKTKVKPQISSDNQSTASSDRPISFCSVTPNSFSESTIELSMDHLMGMRTSFELHSEPDTSSMRTTIVPVFDPEVQLHNELLAEKHINRVL